MRRGDWLSVFIGAALGFLLFAGWFLSLIVKAESHSFYPFECCSDRDCAPISPDRVKPSLGGYTVDGSFFVPQASVRKSPDGDYHACFPKSGSIGCFWSPPPNS